MTIDSIITEWSYRLPKGYPTQPKDYKLLYDVILEMTDLTPLEAQHIVNRAQGIRENIITEQPTDISQQNIFADVISFEQYINKQFAINAKQQFIGLPGMYDAIMNHPESDQLIELITSPPRMQLATGVVPIRGIYNVLFKIIESTIKIPNGNQSELWLAIVYGGQVKGAVAGDTGIEADVQIGTDTVSLKNYEDITFDFGSLPTEGIELLNSFLEMGKLLTGQEIKKSKGAIGINNLLDFLDNEKIESEIRQLIELGNTSDITFLKNIATQLQKFYTLSDNLDNMIHAFCIIVNKMISEKINSVGWWGMIVKPNETLFLESSADLAPILMCRNDRLSPAIANFHQNKLFVKGSQLNTKVTTKPQD